MLSLKILTPYTELLWLENATMVVCPAVEGDIGVMVGHLPFFSTLRSGAIKIFHDKAEIFSMNVHKDQKGIVSVMPHLVTVMLEEFCPLQWPTSVQGAAVYMHPLLRIESRIYGSYKIESQILEDLKDQEISRLQDYFKQHKGGILTRNFLDGLATAA